MEMSIPYGRRSMSLSGGIVIRFSMRGKIGRLL